MWPITRHTLWLLSALFKPCGTSWFVAVGSGVLGILSFVTVNLREWIAPSLELLACHVFCWKGRILSGMRSLIGLLDSRDHGKCHSFFNMAYFLFLVPEKKHIDDVSYGEVA